MPSADERSAPRARAAFHALSLLGLVAAVVAGCGEARRADGPPDDPGMPATEDAVPRAEPPSRYGNPQSYVVFGKRYYTLPSSRGFMERGIASWYGQKFHGRRTSSGEAYDMYAMTAAHKTLPLPSYVQVTRLDTGRSIVVRVNDRGPFHANRVVDLSYAAARKLGITRAGTGLVEVRAIDPSRPSPPPPPPEQPAIYLQIGAFANLDSARGLAERARRLRRGVDIKPGEVGTRTLYRVRVGPLLDVTEADDIAARLPSLGFESPIVVLESLASTP